MSDGLPRLLPDDPKNLLSIEARKRIQRAIIEADKFVWEAEVLIESLSLEGRTGRQAHSLRNEANFDKAKAALSVYRREFSRLDIPERQYRQIIRDEIEGASNSLQLSAAQRKLLETEFFFPEDKNDWPSPPEENPQATPSLALPKPETIAAQLERLRDECRWTIEDLASATGISTRQVARHLSGEFNPLPRKISAYEREFSKRLQRQVVIKKMS